MTMLRRLNIRALVALLMFCSFVWLPVAGIALHFAENAPLMPTRHLLMTLHNLAAAIFLISTLLHLKLNWKPLVKYLQVTAGAGKRFRSEFGVAAFIVTTTLTLGALHVIALSV